MTVAIQYWLAMVAGLLFLQSTGVVHAQAPSMRTHVVLIDRSGSRTEQQLSDMRGLLQKLAKDLTYGDEFFLVEVMQDQTDMVREFRVAVPASRKPGRPTKREQILLENTQRRLQLRALQFADATGEENIKSTDLLRTLRRVGDYYRTERTTGSRLVILSDMIHSTSAMGFTRPGNVPSLSWLRVQLKDGQVADLTGVCVSVAGATSRPVLGTRIREFWKSYFQLAGANLLERNYRNVLAADGGTC